MANYTVVKNPNGGWDSKRDGAARASSHNNTQKQAETEAKRLSSNSGGGEVRIQDRQGKFRDSDTVKPANDPFPPRDKKH